VDTSVYSSLISNAFTALLMQIYAG